MKAKNIKMREHGIFEFEKYIVNTFGSYESLER